MICIILLIINQHQVSKHLASRAARFCNGAAHGGQVVVPAAIVPGLLQAWGCEKVPEGHCPATYAQVRRLQHYKTSFASMLE